MVRKKVGALLPLLFLLPAPGWGLGLGNIRLDSALNQPMRAEIDLLSVTQGEAEAMSVSLASYETFARAGVERSGTLMDLRFSVEKRPNGDYYVKVSSGKPIREPFLDFLIEVNWPSGRLLREYTVLLDPPDMVKQGPAPVAMPTTQAAPGPAITKAQTSAPAAPQPAARPRPSSVVPEAPAQAPAPAAKAAPSELVYGPVKSSDTLWSIAKRLRPDSSVSMDQMMVALLKANPNAFLDNNIHGLKKGAVLRIDDPALISALSKAEAAREVALQTRQWQDLKQMAAAAGAERPAEQAQTSGDTAAAAAAPETAKLELVSPKGEKPAASAGVGTAVDAEAADTEELRNQLLLSREAQEAAERENKELGKRVQELEQQVNKMERLLELKDDDLEALRRQLSDQGAQQQPEGQLLSPEVAPELPQPSLGTDTETQPVDEPPVQAPDEPQGKPETQTQVSPQTAAPQPATPQPAPKPAQPKPVTKVTPKPQQPEGLVDQIMAYVTALVDGLKMLGMPVLLGGGGVLALGLAFLVFGRRKGSGKKEDTAAARGLMPDDISDEVAASSESSFLSDLSISGMGGDIQAEDSEVDPLEEANTYMQFGRYQQAQEVLEEALKADPNRSELLVKLLEVYYETKNAEAFESQAAEAQARIGSGSQWNRVLAWGHELLPENPLFKEVPEGLSQNQAADVGDFEPSEVLDIGLDLDALTSDLGSEKKAAEDTGELDLDFGVDLDDADASPSAAADVEEELEFDLGDFGEDESAVSNTSGESDEFGFALEESSDEKTQQQDASSGVDFDLSEEEAENEIAADAEELSFDVDGFGDGSESEESGAAGEFDLGGLDLEETESGGAGEFDLGGLDLEQAEDEEDDNTVIVRPEPSADTLDDFSDLDFGSDDLLGDMDEIGTKLDLAKAYVEMGDSEGARDMLQEVVQEGDEEQRKKAQELLQQISS